MTTAITLPPVRRWTPVRKLWLVDMIARREVMRDDALRHYGISAEEFESWQRGDVSLKDVGR